MGDVPSFDPGVPSSARIYDYWLGGRDNFAADREAAEQAIAANPGIVSDVRANRAASNTHQVAQAVVPSSRVVYVDHDPATLDLSRPVAVMLLIVLHLIPDADDPRGIVARLMSRLAPGSYLVISHPASDIRPAAMAEMTRRVNARLRSASAAMRDRTEIATFFDGLTLVEPGVVQPQRWRPATVAGTGRT